MNPGSVDARIRVVVGVDGTPHSERALSWAIGLTRRMNAHLLAVHASDGSGVIGFDPTLVAMQAEADATIVEQLRNEITGQLDGSGIDWAFHTSAGGAASTLERVAEEDHADLIVVGSPSRWHILSVPAHLVRRATRPIVVIP
jgi:nucleotide-binding universal stress UspA family protein